MTQDPISVRPIQRCLTDLKVALPDLGVPLNELDDRVIATAQALPEQRDAGGAERVLALADRVWFKVKTSDQRAAATQLGDGEIPQWIPAVKGAWWIGAAGLRQSDSPQHDFYALLKRECSSSGKAVSTVHLLPSEWDWKRLGAEQAVAWRREMKRAVIGLIATSLKTGNLAIAEFRGHRIMTLVRAANGHEAYLAIIAEGIPDPQVVALQLDCVPGVDRDDWQPEPSSVAGIDPGPGQVIWSTLFPPGIASAILGLAHG